MARRQASSIQLISVLIAIGICQSAHAQQTTMGVLGNPVAAFDAGGTYTVIELGGPANRAGSVTTATIAWSVAPCQAAVSLKFFRLGGGVLHHLTDRGPFDILASRQAVSLIPPVPVLPGDLLAVTRRGACGDPMSLGPVAPPVPPPHGSLVLTGDVGGDVPLTAPTGFDVAALATDSGGLALLGGRFLANLVATDVRTRRVTLGVPLPQGDRFGYFSLPEFTGDSTFPEVTVKMADATGLPPPFGGSFWVFVSPLTDVEYTLTVTDQLRGTSRVYTGTHSDGQLCGSVDTNAFPP